MSLRPFAILATIAILHTTSHAETTVWSSPGAGCMSDPDSISNQRFVASATYGDVYFASGKTGTIDLACRVRFPVTASPDRIALTFKDGANGGTCPNGTSSSYVSISYFRTSTDGSGSGATIANVTGPDSGSRTEHISSFTQSGTADDDYFWIRVRLYRSDTDCDVRVYGARLFKN